MNAQETAVPDLLRRFGATPHELRFVMCEIALEMQTNDFEIISMLQPLCPNPIADSSVSLRARVIRDNDAVDNGDNIVLLRSWPVITMFVGAGTVLAVDCERRDLLGFLAHDISARRFADELLPLAVESFRQALMHQ